MNPDDAFWAAKQVMSFTDAEIRAMVATGQYSDPAAAEWVARCLIARRDKIGKAYFEKVLALDGFVVAQGQLRFDDLSTRLDIRAGTTVCNGPPSTIAPAAGRFCCLRTPSRAPQLRDSS